MTNKLKVLFYDIETAGVNAFSADMGFCVVFGYKWLGDRRAQALSILDYPGKHIHDDTNLLKALHGIMEQADLIVAHYGQKFDRPFLESRLIRVGLTPIPNTRQADTCLIARHKLKLSSNRLDNLAKFLGCKNRKMSKGDGWPNWWMEALRGDKQAIKKMAAYCIGDVECLEEIFLRMRSIIPGKYLLDMSIDKPKPACSGCGEKTQYRGYYFSEKKKYRRYSCTACGRWGRSSKSIED